MKFRIKKTKLKNYYVIERKYLCFWFGVDGVYYKAENFAELQSAFRCYIKNKFKTKHIKFTLTYKY